MRIAARVVCISLLLLPTLLAQYQRALYSGKGETQDISASHPLAYWTQDPIARDDGGDLCLGCKAQNGKVVTRQNYHAKTELHRIGKLAGRDIVEIMYRIQGDVAEFGDEFLWDIVLVSTEPGQYAEIFHLQAGGGVPPPLQPSKIVNVGPEQILATYNSDGGNGGGCWKGYWWFDSTGPHAIDFSQVYAAIRKRVPANSTFATTCVPIDFDPRQIKTWVKKADAECHACGGLGTATADFELRGAIAIPTRVNFTPESQD